MGTNSPHYSVRAYHGKEPFCFVSYAHSDSELVFAELEFLSADGFRIYYDEGIHPGHTWHDELASAIENCSLFVFFVSTNSVESPNCQRELNFAMDKDKVVLAIHVDNVDLPSGLQLALGNRQAILKSRYDDVEFRERLSSAVGEYVSTAPKADIAAEELPVVESTITVRAARKETAVPKPSTKKRSRFLSAAFVILVVVAGGFLWMQQQEAEEQQRRQQLEFERTLVEIEELLKKVRYSEAYVLASGLENRDDPRLAKYMEAMVAPGKPLIAQDGVKVSFKPYNIASAPWFDWGRSPFTEDLQIPRGVLQLRLELDGFETRDIVVANPGVLFGNIPILPLHQEIGLVATNELPSDMVDVPAMDLPVSLTGWSRSVIGQDLQTRTPRFAVQKYEVTNAEFKEFVDAGGYRNRLYWQGLSFADHGDAITVDDALALFVDKTGRPGPSTWQLSNFETGEADLPVGGISWFEAMAYARFRGLALPTIYHWTRFALGPVEGFKPIGPAVSQASNFEGTGLVPARSNVGLGPWGTYHSAGNVREWVYNTAGDNGLILGSSWQSYGNYEQATTVSRMDRGETNGLRLIQHLDADPPDDTLLADIDLVYDDPYSEREPVSDEAFEVMRFQFTAARREPIRVDIERLQETDLWHVDEHRIHYTEEETLVVYFFQPKAGKPPFQSVLFGPPGNSVRPGLNNRQALAQVQFFDYILQGGRAVVLPIWTGTYERVASIKDRTEAERLGALSWHRDVVDIVNYLETLPDLSAEDLAYMAVSYGASVYGQLLMAMEGRIKTGLFLSGGLIHTTRLNPILDSINYVPRITQPMLMLNGRYDHMYPFERSAQRMFDLLGTPDEHKKLVGFDSGHMFPRNQELEEVSNWLDEYLGPVN